MSTRPWVQNPEWLAGRRVAEKTDDLTHIGEINKIVESLSSGTAHRFQENRIGANTDRVGDFFAGVQRRAMRACENPIDVHVRYARPKRYFTLGHFTFGCRHFYIDDEIFGK